MPIAGLKIQDKLQKKFRNCKEIHRLTLGQAKHTHANSLTEMYLTKHVIELVLLLHLIVVEVPAKSNYIYDSVHLAMIIFFFIHIVPLYQNTGNCWDSARWSFVVISNQFIKTVMKMNIFITKILWFTAYTVLARFHFLFLQLFTS